MKYIPLGIILGIVIYYLLTFTSLIETKSVDLSLIHDALNEWVLTNARENEGVINLTKDLRLSLSVLRNAKGEELSGSSGKIFKVTIEKKNEVINQLVLKILKPDTYNESANENFQKEKEINLFLSKKINAQDNFLTALSLRNESMLFPLAKGTLVDLENDFDASLVHQHMSQALSVLRKLEIVHNDVKPGNIFYFLTPEGKKRFVLGDFGGARFLSDIPKGSAYSGMDKKIIRDSKTYYLAFDLSIGQGKNFLGDQVALQFALIDQKCALSEMIFAEVAKRKVLEENGHTFANKMEIQKALAEARKRADANLALLINELEMYLQ